LYELSTAQTMHKSISLQSQTREFMQVRILGTENAPCSANLMNLGGSAYNNDVIQVTKCCVNKFPGSGNKDSI